MSPVSYNLFSCSNLSRFFFQEKQDLQRGSIYKHVLKYFHFTSVKCVEKAGELLNSVSLQLIVEKLVCFFLPVSFGSIKDIASPYKPCFSCTIWLHR